MNELADTRWRPDVSLDRIVCATLHTNKTHPMAAVGVAAIPEGVTIAGYARHGERAHRTRARKAPVFRIRCDHRHIDAFPCGETGRVSDGYRTPTSPDAEANSSPTRHCCTRTRTRAMISSRG